MDDDEPDLSIHLQQAFQKSTSVIPPTAAHWLLMEIITAFNLIPPEFITKVTSSK